MKLDNFTAWVQAIISGVYLLFTFAVILVYEMGLAKLGTPSQEKTFDSMVSWMTGGALIVLYFWLQRAKAQSTEPPLTATKQTTEVTTTPSTTPGEPNAQTIVSTTTPVDTRPTTG